MSIILVINKNQRSYYETVRDEDITKLGEGECDCHAPEPGLCGSRARDCRRLARQGLPVLKLG